MITIERDESFKKEIKKLKKHIDEQNTFDKIHNLLKICESVIEIENNPIYKQYGFEYLKHELGGFASFNLCKNGGMIRLICIINKDNNTIRLVYISTNHYDDFKKVYKNYKLR